MRSFKPGDVVLVVDGPRRGAVATVTSELRAAIRPIGDPTTRKGDMVHELDLRPMFGGKVAIARPDQLVRISDPDDAETLLSELRVGKVEETE